MDQKADYEKRKEKEVGTKITSEDKFFVHSFFVIIVPLVSRAYARVCYLSRRNQAR